MLTDSDFRDAVDVDITDDKYLHEVIRTSQMIKKRSKAQFLGSTSALSPKAGISAKPATSAS